MVVFRIGRTKHIKDLTGEGARLFGSRWNHKGIACIYTSESRALAVLEYTVNTNVEDIPRDLSIASIQVSDSKILTLSIGALPGNWKDSPAPAETKDFGSRLLRDGNYGVIKIPSAIIPMEYNYILNPLHADSKSFKIIDVSDFIYDLRIKKV